LLKDAAAVIATDDKSRIVDLAIEANRALVAAKNALDLAKTWLRAKAVEGSTKGTVEFEGALGTAQVVIPDPKPRAKKGVDLAACVDALPDQLVNQLFVRRSVVEFVDGFEARLASLSTDQQAVIRNLIENYPQTPRVTLPQ